MIHQPKIPVSQVLEHCWKAFIFSFLTNLSSFHSKVSAHSLGTVKVIFTYTLENETYILMSEKKSKKMGKDKKLEFLGGKIDDNDTHTFDALLRELNEEETSQTLTKLILLKPHLNPSLEIFHKKKSIYLYHLHLNEVIQTLDPSNVTLIENKKESYQIKWIPLQYILSTTDFPLTKQTLRILSEYKNNLLALAHL